MLLSDESCCRAGMNLYAEAELLMLASHRSTRPVKNRIQTFSGWSSLRSGENCMLWTVFAILLLLWLLGWGFHIAGSLIHLILVIALIVMVIELITGRRAAV